MNIQNIVSLTEMLVATGFNESIGYKLLQHVCFKPADFTLTEHLFKEKDVLTCHIYFERKGDAYMCSYYDASLLKEIKMPDRVVQGVHLRALDQRMGEVDWQMNSNVCGNFSGSLVGLDRQANSRADSIDLNDEASWQREKQIEAIVTDLSRLSSTDEGKQFSDALKLKHWTLTSPHPMMGNLRVLQSRFEVCQRFYFHEGQGISAEEAYRFLLNRWLEKKFQAGRKKLVLENGVDSDAGGDVSGSEKSLLQKKKRVKAQKMKR